MHFEETDKKRMLDYYDAAISKFGSNDARSLNWTSEYNQLIRFKILKEVGDISGHSILDVGCGLGDLYGFLKKYCKDFSYTGVDVYPKFIDEARVKYPGVKFEVADFGDYEGEKFDFVLASGALSFNVPDYKKMYFGYIKKMFDLSNVATAFNLLKRGHFVENSVFATYEVPEIYNFCSTLTGKMAIRQDYLDHDFSVYLYHNVLQK